MESTPTLQQENDRSSKLLCDFFGKNSDYYLAKYHELKANKYSFNYSAFLAGVFWLGHRKLYKELLIVFFLFIVTDIIQIILKLDINVPIGIAFGIVIGKFGNYLYITKATRTIKYFESQATIDKNETKNIIKKSGGTSLKGILLSIFFVAIYFVICLLIYP